ncbi:hypothetical protein LCGC14_2199010 [marine sediment metagenome]|uniref:Glycosyltransferase 61 catalytic domain-containing protein n=1 Tax=marine sediment metagenome TaxID=412755 RepID=A0A0F9GD10_9ZZZZ
MLYQPVHLRDHQQVKSSNNFPASSFVCRPPLGIEDEPDAAAFTESLVPHHYSLEHGADEPFVTEIKDAVVVTEQSLVFDEKHFYLDSYHNAELMRTILPVLPIVGPLAKDRLIANFSGLLQHRYDGPAILIASPHAGNYHHWILETLPRLWLLDEYPEYRGVPIIFNGSLVPFQNQTLERLLGPDTPILLYGVGASTVSNLIFPSFLAPGGHSYQQLEWLRSKFLTRVGKRERLIYVSREDAINGRRIANQYEIEECLTGLGFQKVVLSVEKHADQVELFTDARIIIGISGSGIVNHIFSPEGAHVIEFHPKDYTNRAYFFTTNLLHQTYQFVICDRDLQGNLKVPVDRVLRCVERVLYD